MSKGLEELKRLAYENACCRCQYYIDKKCTNNYECVWKTIEKELKELEERREMMRRFNDACVPMILDNEIEKKLKALNVILSHLSIVEPINDTTLIFDIDLWDTGKQKEDFKFIKEMLDEYKREHQR